MNGEPFYRWSCLTCRRSSETTWRDPKTAERRARAHTCPDHYREDPDPIVKEYQGPGWPSDDERTGARCWRVGNVPDEVPA